MSACVPGTKGLYITTLFTSARGPPPSCMDIDEKWMLLHREKKIRKCTSLSHKSIEKSRTAGWCGYMKFVYMCLCPLHSSQEKPHSRQSKPSQDRKAKTTILVVAWCGAKIKRRYVYGAHSHSTHIIIIM